MSCGPLRLPRDKALHTTQQVVVRVRLWMETFRRDRLSASRVRIPRRSSLHSYDSLPV